MQGFTKTLGIQINTFIYDISEGSSVQWRTEALNIHSSAAFKYNFEVLTDWNQIKGIRQNNPVPSSI